MAIVAKRTIMSLFSDNDDMYSHQVRIVLAEKGVNVDILSHTQPEHLEDLKSINPYLSLPTLIDRDLVLYEARIIVEYLDERFPHPPLMPVYPVARAETRKMLYRIDKDWYSLMNQIIQREGQADAAKERLSQSLLSLDPLFADKTFFLNEEFSLLDCTLAPLLWRLQSVGIELPQAAKAINDYAKRVFKRDAFQASLTETEKQLRVA